MKLTPESLKKIRKDLGLSQMALAIKIGTGRYNISLFETGLREFTHDEKTKLTNFLGKEINRGTTNKKG